MPNGMGWLEKEASDLGLRITRDLKDIDIPVKFCLLLFSEGHMVHYSTVEREVLLEALKGLTKIPGASE